jgi:hypothetical protein
MEYGELIKSRRNHFTWDYTQTVEKQTIVDVFEEVYLNVPTKNLMYPYEVTLYQNDNTEARKELMTIVHRNMAHDAETDPGNPQMLAPWIIGIGQREVVELETRYDPIYRRNVTSVDRMDSFEAGMLATYIMLGLQNRGLNTGISQNCCNDPDRCAEIIGATRPTIFLIGVGFGTNDSEYYDPRIDAMKPVPFDINLVQPSRQQKMINGNPAFVDVFKV